MNLPLAPPQAGITLLTSILCQPHLERYPAWEETVRIARLCSTADGVNVKGKSGGLGVAGLLVAMSLACGGGDGPTLVTPAPPPPPPFVERYGAVQVTTVTSGSDLDADGYVVQTDGYWDYTYEPTYVPTNGNVSLRGISAGEHALTLLSVAPNCRGENLTFRPIVVAPDSTTAVVFKLVCS